MFKKLEQLEKKYKELEASLADDAFLKNQQKYQEAVKEYSDLGPIVKALQEYKKSKADLESISDLIAKEASDKDMRAFYEEERHAAEKKLLDLKTRLEDLLLEGDDPYKDRNIIVEIRAGTGGEEAALFASDLFRMYGKFAANHGFRTETMSANQTGLKGFKEVIFSISGKGCYNKFKFESGTHRVQRVPVTEACGRIHTSAVTVAVLPEAKEVEVEINPDEIRIDVFRSSGPGGQSVNKTESAVRITHLPTHLVVICQDEKSQHKNKAKAMRILRTRLYDQIKADQDKQISEDRKKQVGSGDRSQRIRTYNFAERRVTDHRIGLTLHALDTILEGDLDELVTALASDERQRQLME
ncbi:MAG: peptide chain release factor 1 [Candidatus Omnitrophica bacterium]|nr:peptide chain release factor 1 [Candidatus Omnitrophota bacterium]